MKAIIWVERTNCNNHCNYCIVYRRNIPQADVGWQDWVALFNRFKPEVLDITGGEPFLNLNMVDIIKALDSSIKLGITTNLTQDMTRFVNEVSTDRICNITLSYHPSQALSIEAFLGKALMLKNRGYLINVNFVMYPEQLWLCDNLKEIFEIKHGIRFHVDPYATNPLFPCELTTAEKEFVQKFVGVDRDYRFKEKKTNRVKCSAGNNYLLIQPDGSAFRCMTMVWNDKGSMGNVFSPDFKIDNEPKICENYFNCAGCDMDKVTIEELL